jgi:hypothetical protein
MAMNSAERDQVRRLQERFLAEGGQVTKCPIHAQGTGRMRFNYATRVQRAKEEKAAAAGLEEVRNGTAS